MFRSKMFITMTHQPLFIPSPQLMFSLPQQPFIKQRSRKLFMLQNSRPLPLYMLKNRFTILRLRYLSRILHIFRRVRLNQLRRCALVRRMISVRHRIRIRTNLFRRITAIDA